ncbi:MAG: CCA tRNA nucleotidyltransferase [Clostridia bacterium]|nr:CCA tRNA nucleotidyltransferase [Clostridia bacterium]
MQFAVAIHAKKTLKKLKSQGYEAYIVGGAVRDLLSGRIPTDYDIATNALPSQVQSIFEKCIPTGERHGTVTVIVDGQPLEITTYRIDGSYIDARHPDTVAFSTSIHDDLSRRDFTINAMAYDGETLIDDFGGQADLQNGVIQTVGNPDMRFSEDALRILRAFRFSSVLHFSIEPRTLSACINKFPLLQKISRERIYTELTKVLCGQFPQTLHPLLECGGLSFLNLNNADISVVAKLPSAAAIRYAAFCFLCQCEPKQLLLNLRAPKRQIEYTQAVYNLFCSELLPEKALLKEQMRPFPQTDWNNIISAYALLRQCSVDGIKFHLTEIIKNKEPYAIEMLAVDGNDLCALGMQGKAIGDTLQLLLEAVIKNPALNKKDSLLKLAKKRINS